MITINKKFGATTPAYNPIIFEVSSPEQIRTDFKYLVNVYDANGGLLSTSKKVGGATVGAVINIDVMNTISRTQSLYKFYRPQVINQYTYQDATFKKHYTVQIAEFYNGAIQATQTNDVYTIPAAIPTLKNTFAPPLNTPTWLTNFKIINTRLGDQTVHSFLSNSEGMMNAYLSCFDKNGQLIQSYILPFQNNLTANNVFHFHTDFLELARSVLMPPQTIPTATYKIQTSTGGNDTLTFNIKEQNPKYEGVRLQFLNEFGAVDSFNFDLALRRNTLIEKKKAKLQNNNTAFGNINAPFYVKYNDVLKITSDFITDAESVALLELFTSPIINLECEASLFFPAAKGIKILVPVEVDQTNYEIKKSVIDKLFNVELEVKISVENTRQTL